MYASDSILTLKEPRSTDEKPFAYDRVKVIGPSPVAHREDPRYTGSDAKGVIIQPLTEFAGNLDEPFGKLRTLYNVEFVPEYEEEVTTTIKRYDATTRAAGPTPEDIFAEKAAGKPAEPKAPVTASPLKDPNPKPQDGPLGDVEGPSDAETPAPVEESPL